MRYIRLIIFTIMVVSVPLNYVQAQDETLESNWDGQNEQMLLSKLSADLRDDLLKVKAVDIEQYNDLLHEASYSHFDEYLGYMEASERERYETDKMVEQLELQTEAISILFEHAKDSEKNGLIAKLKTKLEKLFVVKEKERALNIQMLEKELAELKEALSLRQQHKNEIINRRLNELTGKDDYFEW
ncbi:MAG: hypothetical protein PVF17_03420 [Ignavibacteria bacterium]